MNQQSNIPVDYTSYDIMVCYWQQMLFSTYALGLSINKPNSREINQIQHYTNFCCGS